MRRGDGVGGWEVVCVERREEKRREEKRREYFRVDM
jgi:hypothetical protein